jgi:hypothetical protein
MHNLVKRNLSNVRRLRGTHKKSWNKGQRGKHGCHRAGTGRLAAECGRRSFVARSISRRVTSEGAHRATPSATVSMPRPSKTPESRPSRRCGPSSSSPRRVERVTPPAHVAEEAGAAGRQPPRRIRPACSSSACAGLSRAGGGAAVVA